MTKEIEVGDWILLENRYRKYLVQVTRVTKTQIICGNTKINRKYMEIVGSGTWDKTHATLCTKDEADKIREMLKIQYIANELNEFNFRDLPNDKIMKIWKIIGGAK